MSFPDFSEPFEFAQNNQEHDNIQVENMDNRGEDPYSFGNVMATNFNEPRETKNNPQDIWGNLNNADAFAVVVKYFLNQDEEEEKRIQARKAEEDERRSKIIGLMNEEIKLKQEFRDKARAYLDNFEE